MSRTEARVNSSPKDNYALTYTQVQKVNPLASEHYHRPDSRQRVWVMPAATKKLPLHRYIYV